MYNLNLRGVGGSVHESNLENVDFSFDNLLSDIKPILEAILEYHKEYFPKNEKVHWVGHSLGALLMYALLSEDKKNKNMVESFISLAAPVELKYLGQPVLLELLRLRRFIRFHFKLEFLSKIFSFFISILNTKYHNIILNKYAVDKTTLRSFLKHGVGDIPPSLLGQLSDWIIREEMTSLDRSINYDDMGKNIHVPTLLMSGSYDSFCPPHALLKTYLDINLPGKKKKIIILSKISGFSFDYCHSGIIMGKKAREEVFPIILDWLQSLK